MSNDALLHSSAALGALERLIIVRERDMSWRKLLFAIGLTLGGALFLQQVWEIYAATVRGRLHLSQPAWLWVALSFVTVAYFVQMLSWSLIMQYRGISPGLSLTVRGYFLSFLPRYIPGSVWGYWSRSEWLKQYCGINYTDSALVSVLETLALVLTAIAVAGGWLSLRVEGLGGLALGLASAGMLIFTWLGLPRLVFWFGQRRGGSNPHSGGSAPFHVWSAVVVLYIILWVLHGGSIYFVSQAVLFAPLVDLPGAVFVMSSAWLIGFIAIAVPAGIGVRELTLATLLSSQFGLLPWQAGLVAVASRLVVILAEVGWLLVGMTLHVYVRWKASEEG